MGELPLVLKSLHPLGNINCMNEISIWMEKEYPILESNHGFYALFVCVL